MRRKSYGVFWHVLGPWHKYCFLKKQEFAKNIHNAQMSLWMERLFAMCVFGCCEKSVMNDTGIDSVKEAA